MKTVLMILIFALLGCHKAQNDYAHFLQSWIGKSEAELVETWGAPNEMQTIAPAQQQFVYIKENTQKNNFGLTLTYYCQTTFTTTNDIITAYSFTGDGCNR